VARRAAVNKVTDKHERHLPPRVREELPGLRGCGGVLKQFSARDIVEVLEGLGKRNQDQLTRVLSVMAEREGGRAISRARRVGADLTSDPTHAILTARL
jgi:hypothetical protein